MGAVSLVKRPLVDLSKDAGRALRSIGFGGFQANVELILDRSGSMRDEFQSGLVQLVLDRIYAVAKLIDPDQTLPVTLFHDSTSEAPVLKEFHLDGYVDSLAAYSWGGTQYAPPILGMLRKHKLKGFFSKDPATTPTIVIFITDGENSDRMETINAMKQLSSEAPVFVKFIGLDTNGQARFPMLERLDDMAGRAFDNADYFRWDSSVTDEQLYTLIFNEVPAAVAAMKAQKLLK